MAFRVPPLCSTLRLRTTALTAVLIASAVVVPTVASAAPGDGTQVKQSIASVQQRLGALALKNDQLVEKYNQANIAYQATKAAAAKATAAYQQAQRRLTEAQDLLAQSAASQYEGGTFSATGALLSSNSGTSYLDQLDTLSMLSQHNAQVVSSFAVLQKQAKTAQQTATSLYGKATATRAALESQRTATTKQIAKYKDLLASLNARQRAIWAAQHQASISANTATTLTTQVQATSAAARAAVQFALAQVGKPYVFGAAGPDSYDCSGLTMAAWQRGGVSLPHSAADQYNYGHHVSVDQLAPGDLIFMYQPIGHVTIYIGDGMMVSAPTEGENVQVVSVQSFASDIVGATRLVG